MAVECDHVTEVLRRRRGLPAEEVAAEVRPGGTVSGGGTGRAAPADQLLPWCGRRKRFLTSSPTSTSNNLAVLRKFFRSGLATEQTEAGVLVQS